MMSFLTHRLCISCWNKVELKHSELVSSSKSSIASESKQTTAENSELVSSSKSSIASESKQTTAGSDW